MIKIYVHLKKRIEKKLTDDLVVFPIAGIDIQ